MKKFLLIPIFSIFFFTLACSKNESTEKPKQEPVKKTETKKSTAGSGNFPRFDTHAPKKNK